MGSMTEIEDILQAKAKPKEIQIRLVEAIVQKTIPVQDFVEYFESAPKVAKGTCADVMKHVSAQNPEILAPYIDTLTTYINKELPRVKWGISEAIGNMAKSHPDQVAEAIPSLLKNTTDDIANTTVIKWCAAFALAEIAKYNFKTRKQLLPIFSELINSEKNNGVRNVYVKALRIIDKG
jgi:hypothetical protein